MTKWGVVFAWIGALACGSSGPTPCEPPGTQVPQPRAAGCLTVKEGRLLMVQARDGRWSIPGGFVAAGETSRQAAVRETAEEAGVTVSAGEPVCAAVRTRFVAHACAVVGDGAPRADGVETTDARYLSADDIRALPVASLRFPDQRTAYLDALTAL